MGSGDAEGFAGLNQYLRPFLPYVISLVAAGYVEAALVAAGRETQQAGFAVAVTAAAAAAAHTTAAPGSFLLTLSAIGLMRWGVGVILVSRAIGFRRPSVNSNLAELLRYSLQIGLGDALGSLSRAVDRMVVVFFFTRALSRSIT